MSNNATHIDEQLTRLLIKAQFPDWANLPIHALPSTGTDHAIFRLGNAMVVRLPRALSASAQIQKEQLWLSRLAPSLPIAVPTVLGFGVPSNDYPYPWSVYQWIGGENATRASVASLHDAASTLGKFVRALHALDATGGPLAGAHNFFRGVPLLERDLEVRAALKSLANIMNVRAVEAAWKSALNVPVWDGPLTWNHGDLHSDNLLVRDGKLCAVIDFGGLGVGDPACDLMVAWTYLSSETRGVFRREVGVDEATWARGRGWALFFGIVALPYYVESNPGLAGIARRSIDEVLADVANR